MVSSKKTANVSVIVVVSNHRKNTAACVSLSKSTMSKTLEPPKRPNRLTPDLGGGGDLVLQDQACKLFLGKLSFLISRPSNNTFSTGPEALLGSGVWAVRWAGAAI